MIPRKLTADVQAGVPEPPHRWRTSDGRFDIGKAREGLAEFWLEHAENFVRQEDYHEVAAHLVCMAYLQAAVNGGGQVEREYAAGSGRMDILIKWPVADEQGVVNLYGTRFERHLFELKVWYEDRADPLPKALVQVGEYVQRVPCESVSVLVFDRRKATLKRKWGQRMRVEDDQPVVEGVAVWVFRG